MAKYFKSRLIRCILSLSQAFFKNNTELKIFSHQSRLIYFNEPEESENKTRE